MKRMIAAVLVLAGAVGMTRAVEPAAGYANADVDAFEKLIKQEGVVILDVRTPAEFAAGHLAGAVLINVQDKDFAEQVGKLNKSKSYAVYCRSGRRSVTACEQMGKAGFEKLTNLTGGILAWEKANKVVVADAKP